ncbi:MAG: sugar phosphate nucleotidyltransferase [Burkholderiales bacterium]
MSPGLPKDRRVVRALIPVAGRGTRMYPATAAVPKELLPIGNRPLLEFALDELAQAGIGEVVLVTARGKSAIEDFVEDWCARHPGTLDVAYVRQPEARGLGHAVLCAAHLMRDDPFAVLLPDDLLVGRELTLRALIREYARTGSPVLALQPITPAETKAYGVPRLRSVDLDEGYAIEGLVEKPGPQHAPSLLGVVGRYVLPPSIMSYLRATPAGRNGELQLTDAIDAIASTHGARGVELTQRRIDCGSPAGFLEAQLCASGVSVEADDATAVPATVLPDAALVARDTATRDRRGKGPALQ